MTHRPSHHLFYDALAEAERMQREAAELQRVQAGQQRLAQIEADIADLLEERTQLLIEFGIKPEGEGA